MKISGVEHREDLFIKQKGNKRTTVFAGNSNIANPVSEKVKQRKEEAKKQAMKIVSDAFDAQRDVDASKDEARARIDQNQANRMEAQEQMRRLEEQKKEIMESGDPKDPSVAEAIADIESMQDNWQKNDEDNRMQIRGENAGLVATKIEELKSHGMVDATKASDEITESAEKDVIGIVMQEVKDTIDEEYAKRAEEARKKKEEEEEKKAKEKSEEEEKVDSGAEEVVTELDANSDEWKKKLQELTEKMQLTQEDLKGIKVDENL